MIQPIGYFKLWRELMNKPIWLDSTPEQKTILITLLAMANFGTKEWEWQGKQYKADRGQFVTSLDSITKNCGVGISIRNVRTALDRFEKYGFLTNQSTNKNRLITIVNWELYQQTDIEPTSKLTGNRQATDKQLTTREEGKEVKNIFLSDSNEYRLAQFLYKHILKNNPNAKEPNLQSWSKTFDLVIRIDKRDVEDIKKIIEFSQKDEFWKLNILSASKVREKYDQLYLKMTSGKKETKQNDTYNGKDFEFD